MRKETRRPWTAEVVRPRTQLGSECPHSRTVFRAHPEAPASWSPLHLEPPAPQHPESLAPRAPHTWSLGCREATLSPGLWDEKASWEQACPGLVFWERLGVLAPSSSGNCWRRGLGGLVLLTCSRKQRSGGLVSERRAVGHRRRTCRAAVREGYLLQATRVSPSSQKPLLTVLALLLYSAFGYLPPRTECCFMVLSVPALPQGSGS